MNAKILNLFKIKVLSEVCKTNSYLTVSKNLYITPSAVSKIIKGLEEEWNLHLVNSTGNSIKVTKQAEQLIGAAAILLQANDEFANLLSSLNGSSKATILQIGSGGSHSKIVMNRLLASLTAAYPGLEYDVITNNSAEISKSIEEGQLDCGIVSGAVPESIDKQLIYHDKISLYAHNGHPLASKVISLQDITYPVCLREKGSSTRVYIEQFLKEHPVKQIQLRQTGKNDELTDHLCKTENAMLLMSDFYYANSHWRNEYVKIQCIEIDISIPIYFVVKKNFPFPEIKSTFRT
jgi:DNA-binding transcriptional LysR family regulator